jgi:hypothetical protein
MPRGHPKGGRFVQYLQLKGAAAELHDLQGKIRRLLTMYPELADGRLPGDVEMEEAAHEPPPVTKPAKFVKPAPGGKYPGLTNRGTPRVRKPWSPEARRAMSERMKKRHRALKKPLRGPRPPKTETKAAQSQARLEYEQQRVQEERSGKD